MTKLIHISVFSALLAVFVVAPNSLIAQVIWADSVLDYSSRFSNIESSETQVLGKPNALPQGGDLATAWKSAYPDNGYEHIRVKFPEPVDAYQIFVAESYNPGAIASIELLDKDFKIIKRINETPLPHTKKTRLYNHYFGEVVQGIASVRLLLATDQVVGYNAIDAIGLGKDKMPYLTQIEEFAGGFKNEPINLGPNINTATSDRFPVISADNQTLYFCRTGDTNNYGSYYLTDIYVAHKDKNGDFGLAENIGRPLNNGYANFVTTAMPDGNTLVLGTAYQDSTSYKGISISRRTDQGWGFPSNIRIQNLGLTGDYNEYFMTADGLYLLIGISRRDSYGRNDLYVSQRINDTLFSEPINLGKDINTAENEAYPFLAPDGKTLYFCSSGFPGYGETDIYVSRRKGDAWDDWSEPLNLGNKINTPRFEGNISIPASGDFAYFVSSIYGYGQEDIFKVRLPQKYRPEAIMLISGQVTDQETGLPIAASILYEDIYTGELLGKAFSNQTTGKYSISLPSGRRYSYSARTPGFYGIQENIDLKEFSSFDTLTRNLTMAPIKKDYAIRLNNIFFNSGEWELLPGSKTELSQLAKYLLDKDYRIQIEGHTDNIGSQSDNLILSQKRAEAVFDYLVESGVPAKHLTSKGFGETQPLVESSSPEAMQKNRRVEFRVIKGLDTP